MTKKDQLTRRAIQMVQARQDAIPAMHEEIRELYERKAEIEGEINAAANLEHRLRTYRETMETADPENPLCPDCWVLKARTAVMRPAEGGTQEHDQYRCKACGYEAQFVT